MANELRFDGKVALITGAGNGLGRSHALLFASRGARVVVNDLGGSAFGGGKSSAAADRVVEEIRAAGGEAVASYDSVEDGARIVQSALDAFGRIDILVNNAGILRDVSFHKMTQEDWDLIYRVHVLGAFRVTHAAWPHLRDQGYGRVIFTSSAAGIYGNFGQANYSAAKLGLLGFANTLAHEGRKRGVLVNTIAPVAGSRLTETVMPKELVDALKPELVSPLVVYLCHESCEETGGLFELGGGFVGKLRWQRSEGKTFRLGRAMTPEALRDAWPEVTGFERVTYPGSITESMAPVIANLQAGPSKGGNELIDVDAALGYEFPEWTSSYDERDLALYALGVGAAADPLDDRDLQLVYELHADGLKALPTFAVIPAVNGMMAMAKEGKKAPGIHYGFERVLHGEQLTEIKRPLPARATLRHRSRIKDIWDKGKGAVVVTETVSYDESGEELFRNEITAFVRGAGGWGGERGPSAEVNVPPDRAPDAVVTERIGPNQALLYRLSGDWNPLHADPNFASAFGFPRPILHGLCTFGYAGRHVVKSFCGGDPRRFKSIKVRFADSVFPGETLVTEMWKESDTRVLFRCKVQEREKVVISNAAVELHGEIPQAKAKQPAQVPRAAAEPTSADVFQGIGAYVARHPELAAKVGVVYQFKLTSPDSVWTVDLKNGAGSVAAGETVRPECTLELADSDFMGMCTGKLDAQKLYFGGKLKISGNVMASQKLEFLRKIDPAEVRAAMQARVEGGAAPAPAPAAGELRSGEVFAAVGAYVAQHPELAGKVGAVYLFKLKEPDSAWTVDLKSGAGSVTAGEAATPDCTLELSESDFLDMTRGKADPQKLYFGGKLKISGNVMASQKLQFLKEVKPPEVRAAVAAQAGRAPAAPRGAGRAGEIFAALRERVAKTPALAAELGARIQFRVTEPDSEWKVDFTRAPGIVEAGSAPDAAAVLTLSDEDLMALAQGSTTAQSLYQRGRLRVDGDVRAAHKLGFFKQLV